LSCSSFFTDCGSVIGMMGLLSSCPMVGTTNHYPLVEVSGKLRRRPVIPGVR
jgi:hypothetical protein